MQLLRLFSLLQSLHLFISSNTRWMQLWLRPVWSRHPFHHLLQKQQVFWSSVDDGDNCCCIGFVEVSGGRQSRSLLSTQAAEGERMRRCGEKHLCSLIELLLLRRLHLPRESTRSPATRRWTSGFRFQKWSNPFLNPRTPPPTANYDPKADIL